MTTAAKPKKELQVSDEIDAFCTKCHLLTNHRVVALDGTKVKKVICLTCQAQHAYRLSAPKPRAKAAEAGGEGGQETVAPPKPPKAPRQTKETKKNLLPETEGSSRVWQDFRDALGGGKLVPYSIHGSFEVGQPLDHAHFGVGFVIKVLPPNKIEVLFESDTKILIMLEKEPKAPGV